jgi:hypothetical protein
MRRSWALIVAALILAAGLSGVAVATGGGEPTISGMTGCLSETGSLSQLKVGSEPLAPCGDGAQQVSVPVAATSSPAPASSLACAVQGGSVTWDKTGLWADLDVSWSNVDSTKAIFSWNAPQPSATGPVDQSLALASGDWTYAFNDSTSVGVTLQGPSGRGQVRVHLGDGNEFAKGSVAMASVTLFPPDGIFLCTSAKGT